VTHGLGSIARSRLIAVLRARDASRFGEIAAVLAAAGITNIEFTLSSEGAVEALRSYAGQLPAGVALGAGTVLDAASADAAVDAGATYLISPALCLDVIARGRELEVPVIAGALTPSEILAAWRAGASAVKVFPAAEAGGPSYIAAVRAPLPHVPLVPTGGVTLGDAAAYLEAGAVAVGLGGSLIGDAGSGGDLDGLRRRAEALVDAVGQVAA
jgi:2-dehydro-3-deoxyphosphogluconate aldolase / (4S)-4-hydroxy-2-oxoglutarate aldolase